MTTANATDTKVPDPAELTRVVTQVAERAQALVSAFLERQQGQQAGGLGMGDVGSIGSAFMEMTQRMLTDPAKLVQSQFDLWQGYVSLWQHSAAAMWGQNLPIATLGDVRDKRFKHEDWQENLVFDFIKNSYLLTAQWMQRTVADVDGLDEQTKRKLDFYTRQFVDALSPTNFPITNPEVLRATVESGGENLLKGLSNLLEDLERGKGTLSIRMTDLEAFQLGENIAVSPGQVVFQNDLMQLIQYQPSTEQTFTRPLLIIPPWINKFYILDLREKNSFIKWAVDEGHTVFVVSWVNPDERLADKNFEHYMLEGPLAALDAIEQATGEREVNAIGYCLGGTLLASTLAYMARRDDQRIRSATYFTTMLDFSAPGELEVFIDEEQISALEEKMNQRGYLDGREMATSFSMLRANDLVWSFFVNNYLLGKEPFPFDLLFWNSDSTRMPAAMHSFYLRNMYQRNLLVEPNGLTLAGEPIDLREIKTPAYFLSAVEDHIAPWASTYAGTQVMGGPVRFVLGGSGHIAGVINPPAGGKYCYWTNTKTPAGAEEWKAGAKQNPGSWWSDWQKWVTKHAGRKVAARIPGEGGLKPIEAAPGSYVKARPN